MLDNEFSRKNNVLLHSLAVAESRDSNPPRSKPVRTKPFTVYQPVPGQTSPKLLFTVFAYSIEAARAIVAAKVAGETIVVGPVARNGANR
jgi:hypothetical protein